MATIGGNVLQRPRCWYYRLESYKCLKKGGDVCFAVGGENRYHVIFGGGPSLRGASLERGGRPGGVRRFVRPRRQPRASAPWPRTTSSPCRASTRARENSLQAGEVLTEIRVPTAPAGLAGFAAFREQAVVRLAARRRERGRSASKRRLVKSARLVLGAVAPIPWRVPKAEALLVGRALNAASIAAAAKAAIVGATPLAGNGYKVGMVETLVKRTLTGLQAARS